MAAISSSSNRRKAAQTTMTCIAERHEDVFMIVTALEDRKEMTSSDDVYGIGSCVSLTSMKTSSDIPFQYISIVLLT